MTTGRQFSWGLGALPRIDRAGNWPLDDRGFEHVYLSLTHALHVYDYAASVRIGEQAFAIQPGDATITPAGSASRYHLDRPGRHWCVHFHPTAEGAATVGIPLHLRLGALRRHVVDAVRRIAGLLSTPPGAQRAAAEAGASALMLEVLLELSAWPRAGQTRAGAEAALLQAATLIDERLSDRLEVGALARQAGLTQNYLARRFREHFGCTLHGYQLARRIEHAQQLLESTDMPIARIAERLGHQRCPALQQAVPAPAQRQSDQLPRRLPCPPRARPRRSAASARGYRRKRAAAPAGYRPAALEPSCSCCDAHLPLPGPQLQARRCRGRGCAHAPGLSRAARAASSRACADAAASGGGLPAAPQCTSCWSTFQPSTRTPVPAGARSRSTSMATLRSSPGRSEMKLSPA